ncbi:hypothetical protein KNSL1_013811, partial [Colletotrichum chrysophilum]
PLQLPLEIGRGLALAALAEAPQLSQLLRREGSADGAQPLAVRFTGCRYRESAREGEVHRWDHVDWQPLGELVLDAAGDGGDAGGGRRRARARYVCHGVGAVAAGFSRWLAEEYRQGRAGALAGGQDHLCSQLLRRTQARPHVVFYLLELHALTADLDLSVLATYEPEAAVLLVADEVARLVDPAPPAWASWCPPPQPYRIINEGRGREHRVVQVAAPYDRSFYH